GKERPARPEPVAGGAGAVGGVEAEAAGLDRRQARPPGRAREGDTQEPLLPARGRWRPRPRLDPPPPPAVGELQYQVEALGQPGPDALADDEAIDDGLDGVGLRLDQLGGRVGDLDHLAIDPGADQPGASDRLEDVEVLPLAVADQRREELD